MKQQWTWSDIKLLADLKEAGVRLPRFPKRIMARVQRELELREIRRDYNGAAQGCPIRGFTTDRPPNTAERMKHE